MKDLTVMGGGGGGGVKSDDGFVVILDSLGQYSRLKCVNILSLISRSPFSHGL